MSLLGELEGMMANSGAKTIENYMETVRVSEIISYKMTIAEKIKQASAVVFAVFIFGLSLYCLVWCTDCGVTTKKCLKKSCRLTLPLNQEVHTILAKMWQS